MIKAWPAADDAVIAAAVRAATMPQRMEALKALGNKQFYDKLPKKKRDALILPLARAFLEIGEVPPDSGPSLPSGGHYLFMSREAPDLVRLLAEHGVPIDGANGRSALNRCAFVDLPSDAAALIDALNLSPDVVTPDGETPLMRAAWCTCPNTAAKLVELGAKVDVTDHRGQTALHYVAARGVVNPKAIQLAQTLVAAGASLTVKDDAGRTPADCKKDKGDALDDVLRGRPSR